MISDAGDPALDERIQTLRTELDTAGLISMAPTLELAAAFHQAVPDDHDALAATISRLLEQTQSGDYAYYIDIATFMADLPLHTGHTPPHCLDGEQTTRSRWRTLVTTASTTFTITGRPPDLNIRLRPANTWCVRGPQLKE
ncbi:hypothetical protein ACFY2H_40165 [Streptomyces griseofuscus]|uniref:hypothetical protein n=1 Tax=Streptomyces griseofuscus TaxID=146922 RepID=UPI0036A1BF9D